MMILTEDNFILCAMQNYDNRSCAGMEEFREDLNRIKYIKRLLNRYIKTGNLKERLLLNHLIIFYNVFETTMATRMLFFKLSDAAHPALKTLLTFLERMPERIEGVSEQDILDIDIPIDLRVAQALRKI